jgi:hypothetical protein
MVNTSGVPGHPVSVGVTVIVEVIGAAVAFVAVKAGVLPVPEAARPIAVLEFVQANVAPAGVLTNELIGTAAPAQNAKSGSGVMTGAGLTVMVYTSGVPGQPAKDGVMVMVETIAADVAFVAVKEGMLPVPEAARPIAVLEFVQSNVVPAGTATNEFNGTTAPAQKAMFGSGVMAGIGLTVMVNTSGVPGHPVSVGVTVIVEVIGAPVALVAVNAGVLPVPEAARPIAVLEFVQANVAPAGVLTNELIGTAAPAQNVKSGSAVITGTGLTVMVNVCGVPGQPFAVGVTVIVAVTGNAVALTALNAAMFPEPDAARPIDVVLLVQLNVVPTTVPTKFTAVVIVFAHRV